ncbi:MAG TPA: hypothetical protein VN253_17535 [Kofleriaceae bacterium]|nr:hypothetical protein [Kofleriaceae bacterium]
MMQAAGIERPRFRQDLVAEPIEDHGAKFIDVMDPDSGNVFRFYEVEFSIACAMDGERDVSSLVRWAQEELGVTPSPNEVRTVIATLGELGYLDQTAAARAAAADIPRAAAGTVARARPEAPPDTTIDMPTEVVLTDGPLRVEPPMQEDEDELEIDASPPDAGAETSEVSIDLSDHIAVGKEDVQEAVRQSKVMSAVEVPDELEMAVTGAVTSAPTVAPTISAPPVPPPTVSAPPAPPVIERPVARPQTPIPAERAVEPVAPPPPVIERPVEPRTPPAGVPVIAKPAGEVHKPPVELPKVPEKQPVPPPAPARRMGLVLIVLLILVLLGAGAFAVWKLVLDKSNQEPATGTGSAAVAPQPPPKAPEPPPKPTVTAKIELSSGRPKTILAFFPGTIEWIETSGKEAKSNDVIMKLAGARPLEVQVEALKKDVEKRNTELQAIYKTRDAAQTAGDEAGVKKAQTKIDELEKVYNAKSEQLNAKVDLLEPFLVRLISDGTLTITRKVGDKIPENTPIATILSPPEPSATFKIPEDLKIELGTAVAVRLGEKLVTCVAADWEPEKLRVTCPQDPGVVEGASVTWELP